MTINQLVFNKWDRVLKDERLIALYIESISSDEVSTEMIEDCYFDSHAILHEIPINGLIEGDADHNVKSEEKQSSYDSMPIETMPPIVTINGVVEDGNHRLRSAIRNGAKTILAYVIYEGPYLELDLKRKQSNLRM